MGLEVVVNEILARGSEEESRIVREAEAERARVLEGARQEAERIQRRKADETRVRLEALRREVRSASEFEVRRRLLTVQRELSEDFRARILRALADLSQAEREKILTPLVRRCLEELPQGRVSARADDLVFLAKASGYDKGREILGAGGLRVESPDATVVLDYRFETLLEQHWKDLLSRTRELLEA